MIDAGCYRTVEQGISLGCPSSPLMGVLYLLPLDKAMQRLDVRYARYMDDWVILTSHRWSLRRAIAAVNRVLAQLKLAKHPDKTFIGRVQRGFDCLGYWISPQGLAMAAQTVQRCIEKSTRLYEQGANSLRLGAYLQRWKQWTMTGVNVDAQAVQDLVGDIYNGFFCGEWGSGHVFSPGIRDPVSLRSTA